jgi:hypothetical protein
MAMQVHASHEKAIAWESVGEDVEISKRELCHSKAIDHPSSALGSNDSGVCALLALAVGILNVVVL